MSEATLESLEEELSKLRTAKTAEEVKNIESKAINIRNKLLATDPNFKRFFEENQRQAKSRITVKNREEFENEHKKLMDAAEHQKNEAKRQTMIYRNMALLEHGIIDSQTICKPPKKRGS